MCFLVGCGPACCGGGLYDEWYRGSCIYSPTMTPEAAYTCCGIVPLGIIREQTADGEKGRHAMSWNNGKYYAYDYQYTLPLCLQLALCPRGAAKTTFGVEPGADISCCAHLPINLMCTCVQDLRENGQRNWIWQWEWRYPVPPEAEDRPLAGSTGLV